MYMCTLLGKLREETQKHSPRRVARCDISDAPLLSSIYLHFQYVDDQHTLYRSPIFFRSEEPLVEKLSAFKFKAKSDSEEPLELISTPSLDHIQALMITQGLSSQKVSTSTPTERAFKCVSSSLSTHVLKLSQLCFKRPESVCHLPIMKIVSLHPPFSSNDSLHNQ